MIRELFIQDLSLWTCLWQSTAFVALGLVAGSLLRRRPSRGYQVLLLAMMAAVAVPLLSAAVKHFDLGAFVATETELPRVSPEMSLAASAPAPEARAMDAAPPEFIRAEATLRAPLSIPWRMVMLYGWMAATLVLLGRLIVTFLYGVYLVRHASCKQCEPVRQAADRAGSQLGIACGLQVRASGRIHSPVVWCWSHLPILLVPDHCEDPTLDWTGVVAHELAHRRRRDHVTGLLAEVAASLLPWNPLMWASKRYLVRLGEQACDDWVVAAGAPSEDYAESLLRFRPQRQMAFLPAVVHSKRGLATRVRRILSDACGDPRTGAKWALVVGIVAICAGLAVAFAQARPAPTEAPAEQAKKPANSLHEAAAAGDVQCLHIRSLIAAGADVNAGDEKGKTPLHHSVLSYTQSMGVTELLLDKGADVNAEDDDGRTPLDLAMDGNRHKTAALLMSKGGNMSLQVAAFVGDAQAVRDFIKDAADVNAKDRNGKTALHYAAGRGNRDVVVALVSNGASLDEKDKNGDTALHYAARSGNAGVISFLLTNGANVNERNVSGCTPAEVHIAENPRREIVDLFLEKGADASSIYVAAYTGDLATVENLVERDASTAVRAVNGFTPLHAAVLAGDRPVADFLISKGADVNAPDADGISVLFYAAGRGYNDIVDLLIAKGADTDEVVWGAVLGGNNDIVERLLSAGANAQAVGNSGTLHVAALMNNLYVGKLLISHGVAVDVRWLGMTALHYAITDGQVEFCRFLIEEGADVNAKDKWDWTPLHTACEYNYRGKVELLLAEGADVNVRNEDGKTPLAVAREAGHFEIVALLRKHGAKEESSSAPEDAKPMRDNDPPAAPAEQVKKPATSLHQAAADGDIDEVKRLIAEGADVNVIDQEHKDKKTPLCVAAEAGHAEVVKVLLERGAKVDAGDAKGYTPLFHGIWSESEQTVRTLIAAGADVNVRAKDDSSPMDDFSPLYYAVWQDHVGIVRALLDAGAKAHPEEFQGWSAFQFALEQGNPAIVTLLASILHYFVRPAAANRQWWLFFWPVRPTSTPRTIGATRLCIPPQVKRVRRALLKCWLLQARM